MESRRVPVADGVTLRVLSWAPPEPGKRAFVLVHGLSSNALLWDQVADALVAAGHPCHAIDLRSHGLSDVPDDGYTTAQAADDVAAVIDSLGIAPVLAVGQSWGGNVVIDLAARHGDLAAGIGMVDGGLFNPPMAFLTREDWLTAARPPDIDGSDAAAMERRMRAAHPDWSDRGIAATMANVAVDDDGRVRRRLSIEHHMLIAGDMWDAPPMKNYASVHVPAMLIPAAHRGRPSGGSPEEIARQFPRARVRAIDGDHDLHAQYPEAVATRLLELAAWVDEK